MATVADDMTSTGTVDLTAFRAALAAVVRGILARLAEGGADPCRTRQGVDWTSADFAVTLATDLEVDLSIQIETRLDDSDPAMIEMLRAIRSSDIAHRLLEVWNGEVWDQGSPAMWLREVLVAPFVRHYLARFIEPRYVEDRFDAIFSHLVDALTNDEVHVDIVSPVVGFRAEVIDEVPLAENLSVFELTDRDRQEIWQWFGQPPFGRQAVTVDQLSQWTHAIRERVVCVRGEAVPPLDAHRTATAVAMIRLQRRGSVRTGVWWLTPARPEDAYGGQRVWFGQRGPEIAPSSPDELYVASAEDLAQVSALLARYEQRSSGSVFEFALRRFDPVHERLDASDRLVDFWIALEALFGQTQKGQDLGDVTYRLETRIPRFLHEARPDRVALQTKLRKLYLTRNDVVHGSPRVSANKIVKAAQQTEDIARQALKGWLMRGAPPTIEELDFGPAKPGSTESPC
jgi:Apea-like HEPN